MIETTTSDSVLARLEALTTRLDEQAVEIANLKAENARLNDGLATPAVAAPPPPATTSRRGMLWQMVAASAAATVLAVSKDAVPAEAAAVGSISGASTASYGILVSPGATAPVLPDIGGTTHGLIGSNTAVMVVPFGGGVTGARNGANLAGVVGANGSDGYGVYGISPLGPGVAGQSTDNAGMHGKSINNTGVFAEGPIGVFATGTGVAGVFVGSNGNGFGFWGNSATSAGIYGTSTSGPGVRAESTNQFGLHAKGPTWAGVFEGNVFVTGRVIAQGGVGASAAAATGTTRTLAEDIGEATLANGKATVVLAEDFAAAANGDYRVFLTELADLGGLFVGRKGPKEFEVRSRGGAGQAAQDGRFDYRVVAKTSGPAGPRQAPLAPPDLTTVKPAPPLPQPPKSPEPSEERRER